MVVMFCFPHLFRTYFGKGAFTERLSRSSPTSLHSLNSCSIHPPAQIATVPVWENGVWPADNGHAVFTTIPPWLRGRISTRRSLAHRRWLLPRWQPGLLCLSVGRQDNRWGLPVRCNDFYLQFVADSFVKMLHMYSFFLPIFNLSFEETYGA